MAERPSYPGAPRWVLRASLVAVLAVVAFAVMHLALRMHGPVIQRVPQREGADREAELAQRQGPGEHEARERERGELRADRDHAQPEQETQGAARAGRVDGRESGLSRCCHLGA